LQPSGNRRPLALEAAGIIHCELDVAAFERVLDADDLAVEIEQAVAIILPNEHEVQAVPCDGNVDREPLREGDPCIGVDLRAVRAELREVDLVVAVTPILPREPVTIADPDDGAS